MCPTRLNRCQPYHNTTVKMALNYNSKYECVLETWAAATRIYNPHTSSAKASIASDSVSSKRGL